MMKRAIYSSFCILMFCACQEENPTIDSFLEYDNPFRESIDAGKLNELNVEIKNGSFGDIHSLMILRNDKIIFENYYADYTREDLHPIGASTQSIVSTLVGVMLKEHPEVTLRDKIIDHLSNYASHFDDIPQKDQIEIRHLLSNTSGFWWEEWGKPADDVSNDAYAMSISSDWVGAVLSTPMIREPGYEFNFNSGNGVLMAPLMEEITGMELEQYATEKLFNPLGITEWTWEKVPQNMVNASWGLHLKPMDLAKIGYLFLQEGKWGDQQIFKEDWLATSSRPRASVTGYYNYNYFWWSFTNNANAVFRLEENDVFFSWGDGGQFLFIIPHLDMVVVTTANNTPEDETLAVVMLRDYILESTNDIYP